MEKAKFRCGDFVYRPGHKDPRPIIRVSRKAKLGGSGWVYGLSGNEFFEWNECDLSLAPYPPPSLLKETPVFNFELGQTAYRTDTGADFLITARKQRVGCPEPEYCNNFGTWLKQSELKRSLPVFHVKDVKIASDVVFNIPRAMGQSALRERTNDFRDFYLNYICTGKAAPKAPVDKCNESVREVLDNRGAQYTPKEGRSQIQAEMNDAVMAALKPLLPDGLPLGAQFILTQLTGKFTRAVEQGCNGTYSGDNTLDFGGYSACLAAKVAKAKHPKEVVK